MLQMVCRMDIDGALLDSEAANSAVVDGVLDGSDADGAGDNGAVGEEVGSASVTGETVVMGDMLGAGVVGGVVEMLVPWLLVTVVMSLSKSKKSTTG